MIRWRQMLRALNHSKTKFLEIFGNGCIIMNSITHVEIMEITATILQCK